MLARRVGQTISSDIHSHSQSARTDVQESASREEGQAAGEWETLKWQSKKEGGDKLAAECNKSTVPELIFREWSEGLKLESSMRRTSIFGALVVAAFLTGCKGGGNPVEADKASFRGRILAYSGCDGQMSPKGIKVEVPELGVVTFTDDSGYYSFTTSNIQPGYDARYSRADIYLVKARIGADFVEASQSYRLTEGQVYQYQNLSGALGDSITYVPGWSYFVRDSIYVDFDGSIKTIKVSDSLNDWRYIFRLKALNEQDKEGLGLWPTLVISRTPDFYLKDQSSYLRAINIPPVVNSFSEVPLSPGWFEECGLKSGDTFFVAGSAILYCGYPHPIGTRHSEVRQLVMP
jgi:hypothetical protein